jgi:hypothetical protein
MNDDKHHEPAERANEDEPSFLHPHLHPHLHVDVCERCGSNDGVRKGLCHSCREILLGEGKVMAPEHMEKPHQAQPEPLHSPPWRRRGA